MAAVIDTSGRDARLHIPHAREGSRPSRRKLLLICLALITWAAGAPARAAQADDPETLEYRVKAAFLYKFAGYVEWPEALFAQPNTPVTIGVLGAEPVVAELSQLVIGRTANNRTIAVKRLKAGESLSGVHILFIGGEESARLSQLLPLARPRAILTVTESQGALAQGSVINFTVADRRVRFEISLDSAEKSKLKLSSRLLAVAQQVHTGTP